jgi:hypothetical protein
MRACAATSLLLCLALCASASSHAAVGWAAPVEIASGGGTRGPWRQNESNYDYVDDATVALDTLGAAYIAWVDQRRKDVFFQVYERNGKPRYKQPVNVSRSPAVFSWLPRIALAPKSNDVYVLWQEIVFSGGSHGGEIFFARSRDGGATFGKPVNLSNSVAGDGKGRITRDVWHNGSLDIALAADGTLHAAWTEYDGPLWVTRSTDRGESFSKPLRIAGGGAGKPARAPALAAAPDGRVYLAWTVGEDDAADIRLSRSDDAGRTFGRPAVVAQTRGYSDAPKLAVDRRGTLHVVYAESAGGAFDRYHVRHARSRDGGRTFEGTRPVSAPLPRGIESAGYPMLAVDDRDGVYVTWELYPNAARPPRGLGLAISRDGGNTFTAPEAVAGASDPQGGGNGSHQGRLMRKLAVNGRAIALVNSSLIEGGASRVWLLRGEITPQRQLAFR